MCTGSSAGEEHQACRSTAAAFVPALHSGRRLSASTAKRTVNGKKLKPSVICAPTFGDDLSACEISLDVAGHRQAFGQGPSAVFRSV